MFALRRTAQRAVSAHASQATATAAARHISAAASGVAARQLSHSSRRRNGTSGSGTPSSAAAALAAARDTGAAAAAVVPPLRVPNGASPAAGAGIRTVPVRASASASAPAQQHQPVRMQSTRTGTGSGAATAGGAAPSASTASSAAAPSGASFSTSAASTAPVAGSPPGSPLAAASAASSAASAAAASAAERDAEALVGAGAAAEDAVPTGAAGSPSSRQKKRHRKAQDVTGMVAGEQGITLAPGSLPPATAEEHTSIEAPDGPYRATAYEVGEGFDLKKLEQELHAQGHHVTPFQSAVLCTYSPPSAPERGESSIKRAFFMEEGEVVFWGMSQAEEQRWLKHVQRFALNPEPLTHLLVEDMPYFVSRDGHATTVYPDSIMLNGLDDDKSRTRQLMAFSISLARSLQLDSVENDLEKFIKLLEPLPGQLAQQKLPSRAEWAQIVSRQLALRGRLNLHSGLLEIPAIYWAKPKYESYYQVMEKTLDIPNRVAILNTRMDYTEHVTEVVRSELDSKRSHFAEWLIIALITLEVAALIAEKYEPYHNFRFGKATPQQQQTATAAPAATAAAAAGSTKAVDSH